MKYLIMISHDQQTRDAWKDMSDTEREAGVRAHAALVQDLTATGELIVAEALAAPDQAKRVLVSDGRTATADGPLPGAEPHLAGIYLVECDTLARAVGQAARIPEARFGLVEVRPVRDAGRPDS
ncbi:YciI family protein [Micromonospora sp. WMMD987]|uniref:YciI family protein n=1 Tax=Micromonospora sp. WMMD987 TaxID=3016089 RepID=UPI00249B3964|nr:YciI family protein [Micromonospora sp. WMMD987]WFE97835.1 YciI family protein [Micromonospora sp. WMMD987]